jgi:hypothetical protein
VGFFRQTDRAPSSLITRGRRTERTTDELIGLCRGILCDGSVNRTEAAFLEQWIDRNAPHVDQFPYNHLLEHLHHALQHGVLDSHDEADLLDTLSRFIGGEANGELGSESASRSSELPFNRPEPTPIEIISTFVVTGTFKFGPRENVTARISERGGTVLTTVSKKVRYLIVGEIGSRDWIHSSYGRKIEKACELRSEGIPIAIIGEAHWTNFIS